MPSIWIVIPTYNEAKNIHELVSRLVAALPQAELLVVDDNSPDGTAEVVAGLQRYNPKLHLVKREMKSGLGSAYRFGFGYAFQRGAGLVGEMDADLSHQPEDLPKLVSAIETGADLAVGSRRVPGGRVVGWGWHRRVMSACAMLVARLVLGLRARDVTSGFRLYRRELLERIAWANSQTDGYAWQEEMMYLAERARARISEVPITFVDRKFGHSKLGLKDVVEFFVTLTRLRLM